MPNRCNCPQPPGGIVICENNQMALCIIKDGEAIQRCINPPQNRYNIEYTPVELINWALEIITDQPRLKAELVEPYFVEILKSGRYQSNKNIVTFSLPPRILNALDELDNGFTNTDDNNNDLLLS